MALKKIFNTPEKETHEKLNEICNKYGAAVYPKIRLADILPIENSGISDKEYRFALQSHFDFVIANQDDEPLFVIEFDSSFHESDEQKIRDSKKNKLCEHFNLPILRVNGNHLLQKYRNMDLLSWAAETWFLAEGFFEEQRQGNIPPDEPFDPMMFMNLSGRKENFPLWLSADIRVKIKQLSDEKKCMDMAPSIWIGVDKEGNYFGLSWLKINNDSGIYAQTAMRAQQFPIVESELLTEILAFEIYEELLIVLKALSNPVPMLEIDRIIKIYGENYEMRSFSGIS